MLFERIEEFIEGDNEFFRSLRHILGYHEKANDGYCCEFIKIITGVLAALQEIAEMFYSQVDIARIFYNYLPMLVYISWGEYKIWRLKSKIASSAVSMQRMNGFTAETKCTSSMTDELMYRRNANCIIGRVATRRTCQNSESYDKNINLTINDKCKSCQNIKETVAFKNSVMILRKPGRKEKGARQLNVSLVSSLKEVPVYKTKSVQVDLPYGPDRAGMYLLKQAIVLNYISASSMKRDRAKSRLNAYSDTSLNATENLIKTSQTRLSEIHNTDDVNRKEVKCEENKETEAGAPNETMTPGSSNGTPAHLLGCRRIESKGKLTRNQETIEDVLKRNEPLFQVRGLLCDNTAESRLIKSPTSRGRELASEIKYYVFKAQQNPQKEIFGEFYNQFTNKPLSYSGNFSEKEQVVQAVSDKLKATRSPARKKSFRSALNDSMCDLQTPLVFRGLEGNRVKISPVHREQSCDDRESRPLYWRIKNRERVKKFTHVLKALKNSEISRQGSTLKTNFPKAEFSEIIFPQSPFISAMGPTDNQLAAEESITPKISSVDDVNEMTENTTAPITPVPEPVETIISAEPKPYKYKISDIFQSSFNHRKHNFLRSDESYRASRTKTKPRSLEPVVMKEATDQGQGDNGSQIPRRMTASGSFKNQKTMGDFAQVSPQDIVNQTNTAFQGRKSESNSLPCSPRLVIGAVRSRPERKRDSCPSSPREKTDTLNEQWKKFVSYNTK